FTILRTLASTVTGLNSTSALTEGANNLLYGATGRNAPSSLPQLFSLTKDGLTFTPIRTINVGSNPALYPPMGLLAAHDGRLYGYTSNLLFQSNSDGTGFQVLRTFTFPTFSKAPLEVDGKIYGAIPFSGAAMRGSVFRIDPDGSNYEDLVSFP